LRWQPEVPLVALYDERRRLTDPLVHYVRNIERGTVLVLIPEVKPVHIWQRLLQNQRGAMLAHACAGTQTPSSAGFASGSPTTSHPPRQHRPWSPSAVAPDEL
jgi:hypothetical protein